MDKELDRDDTNSLSSSISAGISSGKFYVHFKNPFLDSCEFFQKSETHFYN